MTEEIAKGGDMELSSDIATITAEINAYQRVAGEAIFEIGRRLKHVKENDLAHGEFGKWHEEELGINRSVAAKFMKIVDELGETNVSTSTRLGMDALYAIATLPPEQREQTHTTEKGEEKKPEDMTVKELRELKKRLKAEQAERERLEQENTDLTSRLEEFPETAEPGVRVEVRTEYIETIPDDYEKMCKENAELKRKYGDGETRIIDDTARIEFYEMFANDLAGIVEKYGSIVFDGEKIKDFGSVNIDYAEKVNAFDEFWRRYVRTVIEEQTIIDMEAN